MIDKIKNLNAKMRQIKFSSKKLYIIALFVFIISLIPLLAISFFNFPSADDFTYTANVHNALITDGLIGLISVVLENVKEYYFSWQGTFSAIALMSLQPSVFSVSLYFITTFILLGFLIWGTFSLCKTICCEYFHLNKYYYKIVAILILTLCIQRVPSLVEGFYWWNGGIYYTFFFSLTLFQISHILKYFKNGKRKNYIFALILTALLGGSNLVTASNQVIILTILIIALFIKKHPKKIPMLGIGIILYITTALNMLAPGNAIRQAANDKSDLITSITDSVVTFTQNIGTWWNFYTIVYVVAIILILYKSYEKLNVSFKHPFIVSIFIFGILSALYTPSLYATSSPGPGRLLNIVYYFNIWGFIILAYYWVGYFRNKFVINKKLKQNETIFTKKLYENGWPLLAGFCLVNIMLLIGYQDNLSSYNTFKSLVNKEASTYRTEMLKRYEVYENDDIEVVKLKPLSVKPKALFFGDVTSNPKNGINIDMSKYFNKKSIYVIE